MSGRQALAAVALGVAPEAGEGDPGGELERYRATVRALESVLPREPAPAHLFEAGRKMPRAWGLRSVRRRDLGIGAAVALAVAALGVVVLRGGDEGADASAELVPAAGGPVRGEARLYDTGRDDGRLVLRLDGVPAPPSGFHYQVWILRAGRAEPDAVGAFSGRGEVELELPLPGRGRYAAVDVSVEEDGGDPAHSGRSLAAGTFSA